MPADGNVRRRLGVDASRHRLRIRRVAKPLAECHHSRLRALVLLVALVLDSPHPHGPSEVATLVGSEIVIGRRIVGVGRIDLEWLVENLVCRHQPVGRVVETVSAPVGSEPPPASQATAESADENRRASVVSRQPRHFRTIRRVENDHIMPS